MPRSKLPRPVRGRNYVGVDLSDEQLAALDAKVAQLDVTRTIVMRWALALYLGVGPQPERAREEVAS